MPDRLRAAFDPTHLSGNLANCLFLRLMVFIDASFNSCFLSALLIEALGLRPGAGRLDKTPGGIGFVLTFWFFLVKQKER